MKGLWHQLVLGLRLYFRNRMAMLYGYLFPTVFLLAFWVLYRYERVPLVRHMGELLTVTILGGACFGLATTLVNERERGVWRRYKLAPIATGVLVVSTLTARYVLLLTAGLLQLVIALALGMPMPAHPAHLFVAFTIASFAFLGLGLVIAMMADNVPAVQALGQCIFLPMLIIGGVAVPLTSLPDWALTLSAYFPGRYAVEIIQATVNGPGLGASTFSVLALLAIGAAACVAGAGLFRWDARQRFAAAPGRAWLAVALAGWVAVGATAQMTGRVLPIELTRERAAAAAAPEPIAPPPATPIAPAPVDNAPTAASELPPAPSPGDTAAEPAAPGDTSSPTPVPAPRAGGQPSASRPAETPAAATPAPGSSTPGTTASPAPKPEPETPSSSPAPVGAPWEEVTLAEIEADLVFDRLPPDSGVVTPIASSDQEPDPSMYTDLDVMYAGLQNWAPGRVPDVLTRTRNLLFVPAVVDVFQLPIEPFVPQMVFEQLERDIGRDVLLKALYWIAVHPDEGSDAAVDDMRVLGLGNGPSDMQEVRGRVGVYAVKLIGRITGKRPAR